VSGESASGLLERMLQEVFNETDPRRRATVISEIFSEEVVFTDPERVVRGRDGLTEAITGLLAQGPGYIFSHDGPFRGVGDLGIRAWSLGSVGGEPVLRGTDVAVVQDGRITQLWTMLEA
jgi:SnoaL-like protein